MDKGEKIEMSEFLSKLSKAVDAFTDVLTENIKPKKALELYKYEDFVKFFKENRKENPRVEKSIISVTKVTEFDGIKYSEAKFLIRIVLLDKDNHPISINGREDEILGRAVIANSIDIKMDEFMGKETEKIIVWKGEK